VQVVVSPAWYDDYVLTVGSVGPDGKPSRFSLAGPWVDVAAPGEGVVSLDPDGEGLVDAVPGVGGSTAIAGTSYAAPVVSGIVALLRSQSPELTARQVMQRLEETAQRPSAGWDPVVGHGVVDPVAAVSGGPPTASSQTRHTDEPRAVSTAGGTPVDDRPHRAALRGAAICLAVAVITVAMTASAGRLRRRPDGVPHD
jgi:membrane-anchored mycosin MYCP